jgi:hypothetical protein
MPRNIQILKSNDCCDVQFFSNLGLSILILGVAVYMISSDLEIW